MKSRPKTEALAYRIWAYAEPRGWDVTSAEIATALSEPGRRLTPQKVANLCRVRGWSRRMRVVYCDISGAADLSDSRDLMAEARHHARRLSGGVA